MAALGRKPPALPTRPWGKHKANVTENKVN